jgi:hypothetical protein
VIEHRFARVVSRCFRGQGGIVRRAFAAFVLVVVLAGCGTDSPPATYEARGQEDEPSVLPILNRSAEPRDTLPAGPVGIHQTDVQIDRSSARFVKRLRNGFTVWALRGTQLGERVIETGDPRLACVTVLDPRNAPLAQKCVPEQEVSTPGRLMLVLSGGAGGAAGLRSGEALLIGATGLVGTTVFARTAGGERIAGSNGGLFLLGERVPVEALVFRSRGGGEDVLKLETCQSC